jgi:mRNA interferase MazF
MRRGEIRWCTFAAPDKRRPVLILTRNSAIPLLNALTVAPLTTTMRSIPTEVFLSRSDGVLTDCAVNLDYLQTVPKAQLGALIASLPHDRIIEVQAAVQFALGFRDSPREPQGSTHLHESAAEWFLDSDE